MSAAFKHPTVEAILAIHAEVLAAHGAGTGIRSRELLESAIAAPKATRLGDAMVTDPVEIAAAYLYYISSNHPFVDGNKRVALATCLVLLSENDLLPNERLAVDDWENLTFAVAAGLLSREEITATLRKLPQVPPPSTGSA